MIIAIENQNLCSFLLVRQKKRTKEKLPAGSSLTQMALISLCKKNSPYWLKHFFAWPLLSRFVSRATDPRPVFNSY